MAYTFEENLLRQELPQGSAGTVHFFPKVPGTGNVLVSGTPTYIVKNSGGTILQSSGNTTPTTVNSITRIDCPITAISDLGEDYFCEISWVYSGETRTDFVGFDVVKWPWPEYTVSLNDLQEKRPDIGDILTRHGALMNSKTAEQMASIYGYQARVELDGMVRNQIQQDRNTHTSDYESAVTSREKYSRPTLIINRERLIPVERAIALKLIFAADSVDPAEGDDESSALYRMYAAEVGRAWQLALPLKYDTGGDGLIDKTIIEGPRVTYSRRVQ